MKNKIFITCLMMMLSGLIVEPVFSAEPDKNPKRMGDLLAKKFGFGKKPIALAQAYKSTDGASWYVSFVYPDGTFGKWVYNGGHFAKAGFMAKGERAYTEYDYNNMNRYNPQIIAELNAGSNAIVFKGNRYESTYLDRVGHFKTKVLK